MKIPFDIKYRPQIESGEYKVETRDGKKVRVLCYDANNTMPIVALATFNDGREGPLVYYSNGIITSERESPFDLFIVTPEPEPELSEFEKAIKRAFICAGRDSVSNDIIKDTAAELLELAKDEIYSHESLVEYAEKSRAEGKAEALSARATVLTENLAESRLDKDSIPYHIIEFMCNLYTCRKWKEIEDTAELYVTRIKAAALKDLPRWKKCADVDRFGPYIIKPWIVRFDNNVITDSGIIHHGHYLCFADLEKLPKEDSHE